MGRGEVLEVLGLGQVRGLWERFGKDRVREYRVRDDYEKKNGVQECCWVVSELDSHRFSRHVQLFLAHLEDAL